jgi:hypothetical protein
VPKLADVLRNNRFAKKENKVLNMNFSEKENLKQSVNKTNENENPPAQTYTYINTCISTLCSKQIDAFIPSTVCANVHKAELGRFVELRRKAEPLSISHKL